MDEDWSQVTSGRASSHQFLVPASQPDSQSQDSSAHLPALTVKQKEREGGELSDSEVVYPVMATNRDQSGSVVLVTDSEVESVERPQVSDDAQVIEETVSEDNPEAAMASSGTSSDDAANVTVISRHSAAQQKQEEEEPLSQDLFQGKTDDEDRAVSTPSRHMPSLQLSGQAMLVPETVEESLGDQGISPTPEACGSMPFIIPSTPTLGGAEESQKDYNPSDAATLSSQPAQILEAVVSLNAETESSGQKQSSASASATGQPGLVGPTMAADLPEWQQSQSLNLHLTTSSSASQRSIQQHSQQALQPQMGQTAGVKKIHQVMHHNLRELKVLGVKRGVWGVAESPSVPQPITGILAATFSGEVSTKHQGGREDGRGGVQSVIIQRGKPQLTCKRSRAVSRTTMSVGMVQSQSQSASETTFRLQRPDVSELESKSDSQAGGATMNVFQRTRQGKVMAGTSRVLLSEDSDEFLVRAEKTGMTGEREASLSDSDPIPAHRNDSSTQLPHSSNHQHQSPRQKETEMPLIWIR